jgi:processive 1,2-diacylglycerol beta-glucosyltransferase
MIQLFDDETGEPVGTLTEQQLQFLVDQLEEESPDDTDYYINRETLDVFEENGADPDLLALLRAALGKRDEMEVRWERR